MVDGNVKNFLTIQLKSMVNKLDVLKNSDHCTEDLIFSEFIKLRNNLIRDIKSLYNDDNIKFEINYELDNISIVTFKALNNFTFYLLQGYDYNVVKNMKVTGNDLITAPGEYYDKMLNNNFRKHEL